MSAPTLLGAAIVLAGLAYQPETLTLTYPDGHQETIATTSPATCAEAIAAITSGRWPVADEYGAWRPEGREPLGQRAVSARCARGGGFDKCSQYIVGFNAPPECGGVK